MIIVCTALFLFFLFYPVYHSALGALALELILRSVQEVTQFDETACVLLIPFEVLL